LLEFICEITKFSIVLLPDQRTSVDVCSLVLYNTHGWMSWCSKSGVLALLRLYFVGTCYGENGDGAKQLYELESVSIVLHMGDRGAYHEIIGFAR